MVHMDLYRLETDGDLESIGYWDYLEERGAIVAVEWVDQVPGAWPGEGLLVELSHVGEGRVARVWSAGLDVSALDRELEPLNRSEE